MQRDQRSIALMGDTGLDRADPTRVAPARFKTPYNGVKGQEAEKISNKPGKTIPDQSLSVKELLKRYASGLPLGGEKVPVYDGEEDFLPDLSKMDLADRQEFLEEAKNEVSEILEKHNKYKKFKEAKKADQSLTQDQKSKNDAKLPYENSQSAADRDPTASLAAGGNQSETKK